MKGFQSDKVIPGLPHFHPNRRGLAMVLTRPSLYFAAANLAGFRATRPGPPLAQLRIGLHRCPAGRG